MAADRRGDLLLTPDETAEWLRIKVGTLAVWRSNKTYDLPFVPVGRSIRYCEEDVAAFIKRRKVQGLAGKPK